MRWSQLKKLLEDRFDPELGLEVFCTVQRAGVVSIGRYWFVLGRQTIWDEPKNIADLVKEKRGSEAASVMTNLMRAYLDTPKESLLSVEFNGDEWGLIDLLKAADRRIGKRRLAELVRPDLCPAARMVLELRGMRISP